MWLLYFWQQYCGKGDWEEEYVFSFSLPPISDQLEIPSPFFKLWRWQTACHTRSVSPVGHSGVRAHTLPRGAGCTEHGRHSWGCPGCAARFIQKSELSCKIWSQTLILSSFEVVWISRFTFLRDYGLSGSRLCYKTSCFVFTSQIWIIVCCLKWSTCNPMSFLLLE